ncbi:transcription initiation factor IID, 18kD subunit-domain-containing protein [Mycena amicta]|nr:transcription initiation factor IID, 18kD subunit-domain-containing protein [Mycena amicta]
MQQPPTTPTAGYAYPAYAYTPQSNPYPYSYGWNTYYPQPQVQPPKPTAPQRAATIPSVAAAATGGATGRGTRKQASVRGLFTKELKNLMYGFGDDRNPANDTVNVMEEILIEYITDVCQTAAAENKRARLSIEDLRRALSRPADAKKLARMEELLFMQEDIKRARAQFEENDMNHPREF